MPVGPPWMMQSSGYFFAGSKIGRLDQDAFDRRAVLALPRDHFARAERERPACSVMSVSASRRERRDVGDKSSFSDVGRAGGEGDAPAVARESRSRRPSGRPALRRA